MLRIIAIGVFFSLLPLLAGAQGSQAPMGFWATRPPNEQLYVSPGGCKFAGTNGVTKIVIEGKCSWNPSSAGGILTIMNIHSYRPAPVYYNIIWVNSQQIKVYGDLFFKRN